MRADARRNRESLLRSAAELFAEEGPAVPLETVARRAGVGIGTLYRHFPTREALVSETYSNEITQLGEVDELLDGRPAADALAAWVARFVEYARTKRALADLLHAMPAQSTPAARDTVVGALEAMLAAGWRDGSLRQDMDAEDVINALAGLWSSPDGPDWAERAGKLGRFVVDGLRTRQS
jgi:AcrR family transcriptional regulator